ncbi:ABC transporter substrate-binding protein [Desulfococcaceae bacterium HSG8]|nr:ABC transporter substrate-binding protein [Desulfococcaceae bacterium HSG8]
MKNVCVRMMMCLLIVALCSGQGFAKEPPQPVTIQLNWVTNVEFAGVLLAKERGWYEEAGIDLTIRGWKSDISLIEEVIAGKAQIGVSNGAGIIAARSKGKKIRAIAVQFQKSPFCLISKKKREIETPAQLKGKKIGTKTSSSIMMIKIVLANAGLAYNEIIPVKMGWDIQPLIDDLIDVCPGYMNSEPLAMKEKGYETNLIPAFKHGYDFYSEVYFVTDTMIQKQPDMIRKFLDATLRGWKEAFKDPAATAKLIVEKYYPKGSVSQQTESLKVFKFLATIGVGESLIGYMERPFWQKGIDILYKFKQIDRKIPAEDVFTSEFLKAESPGK